MKRMMIVALVATLVILVSGTSFALNSPVVSKSHGVVTGMFVGSELSLGFEYGLTSDLAITGNFIHYTYNRLGAKYELGSDLALIGGITKIGGPYLGVNTSRGIDRNLLGMGEISFVMLEGGFNLNYELGVRYKLDRRLDIRGGVIGNGLKSPNLQIGVGYGF